MNLRSALPAALIAGLILLSLTAEAQQYYTKSGTPISPADKVAPTPSVKDSPTHSYVDPTAGTYLVVVPQEWLPTMRPFLQWKHQMGFRVETICPNSNNCDSLRATLRQRYESATPITPAQRYILLVGDVDRIRAFNGKYVPSGLNNHVTDLYYGEYTDDYIPEAIVGRLSVTDTTELACVLSKIIAYEQGEWAAEASQMLLAAGKEERPPAPTTTNGQINYLAELFSQQRPDLDTVCFRNPSSIGQTDNILYALTQPNVLVNYTAHCTRTGWSNPYINFTAIDTLDNDVPALFVNNCCLSNAFNGTCFGEELLRRCGGGAVSVIGATNETTWAEDYYWAVGAKYPLAEYPSFDSSCIGAFDSLAASSYPDYYFHDASIGSMLWAGCEAVTQANSPFDAFYWEIYCILGDPALVPYLGRADSLSLSCPDSVVAGTSTLVLHGSPYTRISITQDSLLLGTAIAQEDSIATIPLTHAIDGENITITATRRDARCHTVSIPVAHPAEGTLSVTHYDANEATLQVTLKNVGQNDIRQHHIALLPNTDTYGEGCLLPDTITAEVHALATQSDTIINFAIEHYITGNEPYITTCLILCDSLQHEYARARLQFQVLDHRAQLSSLLWLDSEQNPVNQIIPGHNYLLSASLSHPADSLTTAFSPATTSSSAAYDDTTYIISLHIDNNANHIFWNVTPHSGLWQHEYNGWIIPYHAVERFETGSFESYPWQLAERYPWGIDSNMAHNGRYRIRSYPIDHEQKSTLSIDIDALANDSVSFYFNVSSEAHDWLNFYIDGKRAGYWSGNTGWRYYSRAITPGHHRLQWTYQKDASRNEREDCARLDDIHLPFSSWHQPCGQSEADTTHTAIATSDQHAVKHIQIYPNPSDGMVVIETEEYNIEQQLELFNAQGQLVDKIKILPKSKLTQYSTQHLRFGIYSLVLRDNAGTHIQKMIITCPR